MSQDLFETIERLPRMPELLAWSIFRQVADALGYLHTRGFTHLDLKDENIIISDTLSVKLIDFGSARPIPRDPVDWFDPNYFEGSLGTKGWVAPEVLRGERFRGPEQDVWSLGVLLYVLVESRVPFPVDAAADVGLKEAGMPGRVKMEHDWTKLVYKTSRSLACRDLISRMLEPDVSKRITMEELAKHRWVIGGASSS
jgi:serine/threonine protein kinase